MSKLKNVWNIRDQKELFFLLPEQQIHSNTINYKDVAVIAYIYYEDTVKQYLEYINNIPEGVSIYLISSNKNTLEQLSLFAKDKEDIYVVSKKNRGRDISALTITSKHIFQEYKFVCFVHDKKAKYKKHQKQVELWVENLWGNTLASKGYINNLLHLFEEYSQIGLLVPPEPYIYMSQDSFWSVDYDNTKALAQDLNLNNALIEKQYSPITLGTVFWCRTCAIEKLFYKEWKYEDFDNEPLPSENTISYAVERIFAYLAQDAGYETGTVMSDNYAKKFLLLLLKERKDVYEMLEHEIGITQPLYFNTFLLRKKQIIKYISDYTSIYLFGAGSVGQCYAMILKQIIGVTPKAFLVTDSTVSEKKIYDIPVISFDKLIINDSVGIIISVTNEARKEDIRLALKSKNYIHYLDIESIPTDLQLTGGII